jgi:glycerophosphoryl diester phosphodiesterase
MMKHLITISTALAVVALAASCEDRYVKNDKDNAFLVSVDQLSAEMQQVRDYVPKNAVVAHRGSTFWTPEETEAAYRWARDMGADYLEADLQVSKDGVILALHDDNLKRTTNIENVFGEDLPAGRKDYYISIGYSSDEADAKVAADKKSFRPNLTSFYTYSELMQLDAGSWFNETSLEQARPGFNTNKQYISTLEDLVSYAKGKRLERDANGDRVVSMAQKTGATVKSLSGEADVIKYTFGYETDPNDSGNRPGIYIEFKESWLNPGDIEARVLDELDALGMNIITAPANGEPFYKNGKVNVGETNGKVILQTFSLESLVRVAKATDGKIPMCFLLWEGTGATDLNHPDPLGYASFINLALKHKAHIIGPCIAGAPNNYPDLNKPWQAYLIKKSGMLNHPYSFDTRDQMALYYGDYNWGVEDASQLYEPPYLDAMFTNRTEMTLRFFIDKGVREPGAPATVPDAQQLLQDLGY